MSTESLIGSTISFKELTTKDKKELVSWLHERIAEIEVDEEFTALELDDPRFVPSLRGLRDFVKSDESSKNEELIKQLQNENKHLQERMDVVLHAGPSTKLAVEVFDRAGKYKELQESWFKLHTTICEIALHLGWSDDAVGYLAGSMACEMGDGREVVETLKKKLNIND